MGHLAHPKATDLQMEYFDIPSANPSLYDPYKKKSPSGSEDPRMEPAEAAAEAKEQRDKGWNAKTSGNAGRDAGSSSYARIRVLPGRPFVAYNVRHVASGNGLLFK